MFGLKCCSCGKPAERFMEGFTLCMKPACYVKAHLPGYGLTIAIYGLLIVGAAVMVKLGLA